MYIDSSLPPCRLHCLQCSTSTSTPARLRWPFTFLVTKARCASIAASADLLFTSFASSESLSQDTTMSSPSAASYAALPIASLSSAFIDFLLAFNDTPLPQQCAPPGRSARRGG